MAILERDTVRLLFTTEFWRMTVFWPISLLYSYLLLHLGDLLAYFRPPQVAHCHPRGNSPGTPPPVCVVTGATSGLGAEVARVLAGKGYYVVLVGRSLPLLSETMQRIKQHNSHAKLKGFDVDLSSIHSIIQFKCSIEDWLLKSNMHPSSHLLINNAGILAASSRATVDGYDQMMVTNYISTFFLTNLLWSLLKNSPRPSRVINVTSLTHRCVSKAPLMFNQNLRCYSSLGTYPLARRYEISKFWLVLFTYELHRKLCLMDLSSKVSVLVADPGAVETNIAREPPKQLSRLALAGLRLFHLLQTPKDGVASILDAALAPPEISGQYFFGGNGRTVRSSNLTYNTKLAKELWDNSMVVFHEATSKAKHCNREEILLFSEQLEKQHRSIIGFH